MSTAARQIRPSADLAAFVDAFWSHDAGGSADAGTSTRVDPDGCMDLVFRISRAGRSIQSELFIAGAMDRAQLVPIRPGDSFVGVRFRSGMSRIAIDADPIDLRGRDTRAASVGAHFARLEDRLRSADGDRAWLALLAAEARIWAADADRRAPHHGLRAAIDKLSSGQQQRSIAQMAGDLGVSVRTLHREVTAWTGLPPTTLSRIGRLQRSMALIRTHPMASLTAVAHEAGYADHAHMTRAFRTLTGVPPSRLDHDRGQAI